MNTHDIELPPLPKASKMYDIPGYDEEELKDYARAAIEADRKRRGEPGLLMVQEADTIPHFHPEYGPGIFFTEDAVISPRAPQPAEPVKRKRRYAQGTALGEFGIIPMCDQVDDDPVKVPSDDEILFTMRHLERHLKCIDGAIPTLLSTARSLLARYGRPAAPSHAPTDTKQRIYDLAQEAGAARYTSLSETKIDSLCFDPASFERFCERLLEMETT